MRPAQAVARGVVGHVRRHDLVFYAAGLTFCAAIAIVPLLLVDWRDRRAKGLRGRLLGLVLVAALPPVVMAELGAVAVLPDALGFTGRFNLVSVAVAFVVGWLSATLLVGGYVLSLVLVGFGGERAPLRMDQGLRRGPRATDSNPGS
jgi:hypothetical protein